MNNDIIDTSVSGAIGALNMILAGNLSNSSEVVNFIVAIMSFGWMVYKIIRKIITHVKEKHGKNCDCLKDITDIINGKDKDSEDEDGEE